MILQAPIIILSAVSSLNRGYKHCLLLKTNVSVLTEKTKRLILNSNSPHPACFATCYSRKFSNSLLPVLDDLVPYICGAAKVVLSSVTHQPQPPQVLCCRLKISSQGSVAFKNENTVKNSYEMKTEKKKS